MSILGGPVLIRYTDLGLAPSIFKLPLLAASLEMEKECVTANLVKLINQSLDVLRRNGSPAAVIAARVIAIVASFENSFGFMLGFRYGGCHGGWKAGD